MFGRVTLSLSPSPPFFLHLSVYFRLSRVKFYLATCINIYMCVCVRVGMLVCACGNEQYSFHFLLKPRPHHLSIFTPPPFPSSHAYLHFPRHITSTPVSSRFINIQHWLRSRLAPHRWSASSPMEETLPHAPRDTALVYMASAPCHFHPLVCNCKLWKGRNFP